MIPTSAGGPGDLPPVSILLPVLNERQYLRDYLDSLARQDYAHLFFFQAPVDAPGVKEHVPGLVRLTVRSLNDLSPGKSAAVDRICDEILCGGAAQDHTTPNQTS